MVPIAHSVYNTERGVSHARTCAARCKGNDRGERGLSAIAVKERRGARASIGASEKRTWDRMHAERRRRHSVARIVTGDSDVAARPRRDRRKRRALHPCTREAAIVGGRWSSAPVAANAFPVR